MSETVFGILTACVLYFVYFFLSKIIQKFKRKAAPVKLSPTRRWVRRWGFAFNWLAVSAFIWMAMVSFQSYMYYGTVPPRVYYARTESALQELSEAQKAYQEKYGRYAQSFKELEWSPSESSRMYSYFMGDDILYEDRGERTILQLPSGLYAPVSKEKFTAFAVSDLDGDAEADVWRLNEEGTIEHMNIDLRRKPGDTLIMVFGIASLCFLILSFRLNMKQNRKLHLEKK